MTAYVKREGSKRFGAGSKPSFGARSGKPAFAKKTWEKRSGDGPVTLFKATCSKCGSSCDVPFKPVNGKPVFCRNCFVKTGDTATAGRAGDRYPKREFPSRSYATPVREGSNGGDVLKKLEEMNTKLERLIQAVEASAAKKH